MKKNRAISATTTILVCCWLLFGLQHVSIAENIPISPGGVDKIGDGKIRLESGIGVVVFDMSKIKGSLEADGYLTLSNTFNTSFNIQCRVITVLSPVDLTDGKPRVHHTINDRVVFKPLPSSSAVVLESKKAVIEPFSIYNFHYHISLTQDMVLDDDMGYLFYINIGRDISNSSGPSIGINYNYKVFIVFTNVDEDVNGLFYIPFAILVPTVFITMIIRRRNHKDKPEKAKKTKKKKEKPIPRIIDNPVESEVVKDSDDVDDAVDSLFKKLDLG